MGGDSAGDEEGHDDGDGDHCDDNARHGHAYGGVAERTRRGGVRAGVVAGHR